MSGIRNSSELGSKWSLGSHTLISIANVIPQEEQNLEVVSSGNSESNEQSVSSRITHSADNESAARGRLEEDPYVAEATRYRARNYSW